MAKEIDRVTGVAAGFMKVAGAAIAVGADKIGSPALLANVEKLAATGHHALGNVEAGLYLTLHTPPQFVWAEGLTAGLVMATAVEQVVHPPGEKMKFWASVSLLYGLSAMLEPNILAVAHQHPSWGGVGFVAWAIAAITCVEGSRIAWNFMSHAAQKSERQPSVTAPTRLSNEKLVITHHNAAKEQLEKVRNGTWKPAPSLPRPASKEIGGARFRNIMNDPSNKES